MTVLKFFEPEDSVETLQIFNEYMHNGWDFEVEGQEDGKLIDFENAGDLTDKLVLKSPQGDDHKLVDCIKAFKEGFVFGDSVQTKAKKALGLFNIIYNKYGPRVFGLSMVEEDNLLLVLERKSPEEEAKAKVPYFIQKRGCINCEVQTSYKEKTGNDYGFDHELMAGCILSACVNYGHSLVSPFLDPEEGVRLALEQKWDETQRKNLREYIGIVKENFGEYYESLGVDLGEVVKRLDKKE